MNGFDHPERNPYRDRGSTFSSHLSAGDRLGPYEILAPIGAGGMGDVYKARDTRLDRVVAIKVCAEQFSERFEREARAVAALNHPNICALYDVGPNYLVMEYQSSPIRFHNTMNRGSLRSGSHNGSRNRT